MTTAMTSFSATDTAGRIPDAEIIAGNLRECRASLERLGRLRRLEAFELLGKISGQLADAGSASRAVALAAGEFGRPELRELFDMSDIIEICRRLLAIIRASGLDPLELLLPADTEGGVSRIGYVDNPITAAALELLSSPHPGCTGVRYSSFADMCEDTAAGGCDACILPLENTSDGKLLGFYSLIDRFDLKICSHCDIYSDDDTGRTRYALLRRSLCLPANEEAGIYFEIGFTGPSDIPHERLLCAAGLCRLSLCRVDSIPLRYSEPDFILTPVLHGSLEDILAYAAYLAFVHVRYNIAGISSPCV